MIAVETWQMFGGLLGILIALGGAALALQRLGILRSRTPPAPAVTSEGEEPEAIAELRMRVGVLEERTRQHEISLQGIGKVHARIDDVANGMSRLEGVTEQMNGTLKLILRHMMGDRAP